MAASTSSKPELRVRRRILAGHRASRSAALARGAAPRHAAAASHAVFARSLLQVSETWDTCIENTIRKLAYGALGGVVLSVVLFRAPPPAPRAAAAAAAAALLPPRAAASPAGVPRFAAGAPVARSAVVGLGAGVGVGMGYTDCKHEFDAIDRETASAQK